MIDYVIVSYQNGEYVPILHWSAKDWKLYKVYKEEDPNDWSGLIWFGNSTSVPRDSPECSWKNEFCLEKASDMALIGGLLGMAFLIVITLRGMAAKYAR